MAAEGLSPDTQELQKQHPDWFRNGVYVGRPESGGAGASAATPPASAPPQTPSPNKAASPRIELPPEADVLYGRMRRVEGTAAGSGYVQYGGKPFEPGKDHPGEAAAAVGPDGRPTHAAGPGQWQPGTWAEEKDRFKKYGVDLDFSNEQHQKAAVWERAYDVYKKAGLDLREDLKNNKVQWDKLAGTWQGFTPRVTQTDKPGGRVDERAVAYAQSRPHQSVWYMDPHELLAQLPEQSADEETPKRRSLMKNLELGEDIYDLPEIQVSDKGNVRKITDWDGRNRIKAMIEAGLTAVPVVVKGLEPGVRPDAIEGLTGKSMPIRFDPVPGASRETNPIVRVAKDILRGAASDRYNPYESAKDVAARAVSGPSDEAARLRDQAHTQQAANREQVYYNEAGQPFTRSGAPVEPPPQQPAPERLPGEIPGVGRLTDMIAEIVRGAELGGMRARGVGEAGQDPLRPLAPETMGAAAALGGMPGAPGGGRFGPVTAPTNMLRTLAPEGQNMLAAGERARSAEFPRPVPIERLSPEDAALAKEATDRFKIPLYGKADPALQTNKERAIVQAASHTIGEDAPALTADVMDRARLRIGNGLQRIETGHDVRFDPKFRQDMIGLSNDANSELPTPGQIGVVDKQLKAVMVDPVKTAAAQKAAAAAPKVANKPKVKPKEVLRTRLSGEQFGNLMHQGGPIEKMTNNTDPGVAQFGERIETALRDLFQRQLPDATAAEYQGLRYQWKNLKTLERAIGPTGELDHGKLSTAVSKSFPRRVYDKGSDLVKLSDIANKFGKQEEQRDRHLRRAEYILGGLGGLAGHMVGGIPGAVMGAVGTIAGERAVAHMLRPRLTEKLVLNALARPSMTKRNAINDIMSMRGANTLVRP